MKVLVLSLFLIINASWVSQLESSSFGSERTLTSHQQLYFSPVELTQGLDTKNSKAKNSKDPLAKNLWVFEVSSTTPHYESEEAARPTFTFIPLFILFCSYLL